MKNRLTKSQLEQLIREQLTEEIRQQLDEGFFQSLKDGLASMLNIQTSKEKEAAREKLKANVEKEGNERIDKFIKELDKQYENFDQFPNMEDKEEFKAIIVEFKVFYDSIKAGVEKYKEGKGPEEQPKDSIPTDIANEYVELLHQFLYTKQEEIRSDPLKGYQYRNENNEEESDEVLAEIDWEKEAQKIADEEGDTKYYDKETLTTKDLKSKKAPIALGIAGIASLAIGAKLIAMGALEGTVSEFVTDPGKLTQVPGETTKYADSLVDSEGRGFLRTFRDAAASTGNPALKNIDFSENVDTLAKVYNQDPKEILMQGMQDLGREEFRGVSGEMAQQLYEFDKMGGAVNTVITQGPVDPDFIKFVTDNGGSQELISTLGTTTGSGAVPDAGVTILGMEPGGAVSTLAGKALKIAMKRVLFSGAVSMVGATTLGSAGLLAAGAVLGPIGVGLVASAIAVGALRYKGLKSSRNQQIEDLREKYIRKFPPKDPVLEPKPEQGGEEPAVDEPAVDEPATDKAPPENTKSGGTSKRSSMSGSDYMDKFLKKRSKGTSTRVRPPTDAGTMRRRKKTRGGRALEETTEINETLARWKKIAGIIKESKDD